MSQPLRVIWDLDGTLVDSYGAIAKTFEHLIARSGGASPGFEAIMREAHLGFMDTLQRWCPDVNGEPDFWAVERVMEHPLFPGALDALACADENHLATNRYSVGARELLDAVGLGGAFGVVVAPGDGFAKKPSAEMYEHIVSVAGEFPGVTLVVGDRSVDLEPARELGFFTCAFGDYCHFISPDFRIASLTEFPAVAAACRGMERAAG